MPAAHKRRAGVSNACKGSTKQYTESFQMSEVEQAYAGMMRRVMYTRYRARCLPGAFALASFGLKAVVIFGVPRGFEPARPAHSLLRGCCSSCVRGACFRWWADICTVCFEPFKFARQRSQLTLVVRHDQKELLHDVVSCRVLWYVHPCSHLHRTVIVKACLTQLHERLRARVVR